MPEVLSHFLRGEDKVHNPTFTYMSISTISAIVFGLSFGIGHFVGNGLLALVAAIAAIVWGITLILRK